MANQTELAISLQYKGRLFRVERERIEEEYKEMPNVKHQACSSAALKITVWHSCYGYTQKIYTERYKCKCYMSETTFVGLKQ